MRRSNFALRLQPSLLEELRKAAELEGVTLNQLICGSGGKGFCFAYRGIFSGKGSPWKSRRNLADSRTRWERESPYRRRRTSTEWHKKPGRKVANGRHSASKRGQKKRAAVK